MKKMPELPEVETVIRYLNTRDLINQPIIDVIVNNNKLLKNCATIQFKNALINNSIKNFTRIGKYIIAKFNKNDLILLIHLRMEGKLIDCQNNNRNPIFVDHGDNKLYSIDKKHCHIIFKFKTCELRYYDTRLFGTFHLYNANNYLDSPELKKIGYEPKDVNVENLFRSANKKHSSIKSFLLDQTNIAGLGNIYVDEVLFASKIHPNSFTNNLAIHDFVEIIKASIRIFNNAIKYHGTTVFSYRFGNNKSGGYQKYLMVYGRANQPCKICHNIIKKTKINGRGTTFCPHCQKIITK
jgi:formamidopyrimidine-DNA glycosylase